MDNSPFTGLSDLKKIHQQLQPYIHRTPVLTSRSFNELTACHAFFKCENFQKTGSFKMRGALNAVLSLTNEERKLGVATHSSGNFAQAVAASAKIAGIKATVIMPDIAPIVKKNAIKALGAEIIECEPTYQARQETLDQYISKTGAIPLHSSNQKEVIEGNSSAVVELLEDAGKMDIIVVPVGGGGLLAGTALASRQLYPDIKIYAGEPGLVDDAYRSFHSGILQPPTNAPTVADGLKTCLGDKNFPIIKKYVENIILIEENEIISMMKWIWERMKIIIEPSSAVAAAVLLKEKSIFRNKKVGIILSGGNVSLNNLPF